MKILFVCSGNSKYFELAPFIRAQATSLRECGLSIDFSIVKRKGLIGYLNHVNVLRKLLDNSEYELIHAHYSLCGIIAFLATLISLRRDKVRLPVVVSLMGSDVRSGGLWLNIVRFFVRRIWKRTIVKSSDMKQNLGLSSPVIIPNGVNFETFRHISAAECVQELEWDPYLKYVLFGADPTRDVKNYPLAKQSFDLLSNKNCKLITIGDLPHDKVPMYLNACGALLLTSKWEGSPNIVKEAMACGTPIICTDVGDVRWLLEGLDGCSVTSHDPQDIASQLNMALQFDHKTRGRERLIELGLDSESVAKRLVELYDGILSASLSIRKPV